MNNAKVQTDFCPQCGALARDGVCTSCGFVNRQSESVEKVIYTNASGENTNPYANNTNPYAGPYVNNTNQYVNDTNAHAEYINYIPYTNGSIPSDVPVKKKNSKTWIIIGICVGIFVLLIILLGIAIGQLVSKINDKSSHFRRSYTEDYFEDEDDYDYDDYFGDDYNYSDFYNGILEENGKSNTDKPAWENDGEDSVVSPDGRTYGYTPEDDYYYQLNDNLREDLSYSVYFDSKERTEGEQLFICCNYPVLEGDIPNIDYLNDAIYDEYLFLEEFYDENLKEHMAEDDYYYAMAEGYVTYMDEDVISVVFKEETLGKDYVLATLYCINIDVKKGIVIDNTEILDADDEFSIDFRTREAKQNQSDTLDYYTDQELTEMLNDTYDLIIFYTPLGMEVGINHDFGWSTATYKDYKSFLKQF